ncbi:MAG: hypothetical protein OEZ19_02720 [Paracoccaceae bacterium]|nr:hypothetical protein [Paracoccaceae bacterium]
MLKKFLEGIAFGGGFTLSFIVLWSLASYLLIPKLTSSILEQTDVKYSSPIESEFSPSKTHEIEPPPKHEIPFHDLPIEGQIQHSSVIALAKYEPAPDGQLKAIIKEFFKKDPGVTIYYDIGDEHALSSHYPKDNTKYGDGEIIFFTGNPATMRMSISYSGNRIHGLGDLPIELLRKKCQPPHD